MEIDPKLVNRYFSISGDRVEKDRKGLLAEARVKNVYRDGLSKWAIKRLKVFIKDLEK